MTALEIIKSNICHERTHPNMWFELRAEYDLKEPNQIDTLIKEE